MAERSESGTAGDTWMQPVTSFRSRAYRELRIRIHLIKIIMNLEGRLEGPQRQESLAWASEGSPLPILVRSLLGHQVLYLASR